MGESFAREVEDAGLHNNAAGATYGILLPLQSGSTSAYNWGAHREGAAEAYSGFVISQKETNQVDLFRLKSLHVGEDIQKSYMVAIENIKAPTNSTVNPFGTFTLCIKTISGQTVERYTGLNFNPDSPDYIARRIGDQYLEWDETDRRYRTYGDFQNQSNIVYVELKQFIKDGGGQGHLPAGFKGPVRPKGFTLLQGSLGANNFGSTTSVGAYGSGSIRVLGFTYPNDDGFDTPTIILDDGINPAITFTISGSGTTIVRNSATSYSIPTGSVTNNNNMATRLATGIDTARTNGDSTIRAEDKGNAFIGLTSSVAGTSINGKTITGTFIASNTGSMTAFAGGTDTEDFLGAFVKGNASMPEAGGSATAFADGPTNFTASFLFPALSLRSAGTDGGAPDPYRAYYGIRPKISNSSNQYDPDYCDYLRRLPAGISSFTPAGASFEHSFVFTLDDLVINTTNNTVTYTSGSGNGPGATSYSRAGTGSFGALLDLNVRQFLMPLFGGSDGFDITEKEPLRDDLISSTRNDRGDHIHYTINKALDSVRDSEVVPANMILMPGIRKPVITDRIIDVAQSRKDVLAIVDLEGDYKPSAERVTADTDASSLGSVTTAVSRIKQRALDSSYACSFYPWVQVSDNLNGGNLVWIPPSVAALGAMGRSQARSELWFAPAGFNRGGLGSLGGPRGPKVLQARQRLDSKERDLLYEVNINPIATFPAEGVVIFGQKTLQADQSALDRINVRRLVLFLKAEVSNISRNLLFDQNLETTWNRFKAEVEPLLSSTRARFGLSDYKVVLDETTTTADLVDRNIMYAKIYIKPARAIEYIVVDFVITNTGADFV